MPGVTEPETGLVFYELSHEWGHDAPTLPGFEDVKLYRASTRTPKTASWRRASAW